MVTSRPEIHRLTLDDLTARSWAELGESYAAGAVPASLRPLDGPLVGRMVRLRATGPLTAIVRWIARAPGFVWAGKTFDAQADGEGRGINRIRLPGLLGRQALFPFATRFGPSRIDGRPAVILDYTSADNPPWIRPIHDEVREIDPGLFLGPAMWTFGQGKRASTVLWFALDAR
ncbi:MAG: hypothetical protein ABMB14_16405 [Myxococcota bacterium]